MCKDPTEMSDEDLVIEWSLAGPCDPEDMPVRLQAIIDEIERRNLDI